MAKFTGSALAVVICAMVANADDRHTFTIYNQLSGSDATKYLLANGTTVYDYNHPDCESWGPPTLTSTLPAGSSTSFTVHGSSWCNIVGTLGSGYFRYDVQTENPITHQRVTVGYIQGQINFQENWGTWVIDDMSVAACQAPVTCSVNRVDEANANFYISNGGTSGILQPGENAPSVDSPQTVYPDIAVSVNNTTSYVGWQASLTVDGPWCADTTQAPQAIYPNVNPGYYICVNDPSIGGRFASKDLNAVYKLVDSSNQIVSTCNLHVHKDAQANRTCEACSCDGAVKAEVLQDPLGVSFTITWFGVSDPEFPTDPVKVADRMLRQVNLYRANPSAQQTITHLHAIKNAAAARNATAANQLSDRVRQALLYKSKNVYPPDVLTELKALGDRLHF